MNYIEYVIDFNSGTIAIPKDSTIREEILKEAEYYNIEALVELIAKHGSHPHQKPKNRERIITSRCDSMSLIFANFNTVMNVKYSTNQFNLIDYLKTIDYKIVHSQQLGKENEHL